MSWKWDWIIVEEGEHLSAYFLALVNFSDLRTGTSVIPSDHRCCSHSSGFPPQRCYFVKHFIDKAIRLL
jgi:hypothetical protein